MSARGAASKHYSHSGGYPNPIGPAWSGIVTQIGIRSRPRSYAVPGAWINQPFVVIRYPRPSLPAY